MTLADAFTAHDEALSYGGRNGVTSLHLIESALARPYSGYHRSISQNSVVGNHGFADGNKRTAWILVELLINRSGYQLNVPEDEPVDDLVVDVARGIVDFASLVLWFRNRLIKI